MKLRSKSLRKNFPKKRQSSRPGQFYNKKKIYNRARDKKAYERDINLAKIDLEFEELLPELERDSA